MDLVQNFPAVSILLCLFAGIISSGLKEKAARYVNTVLIATVMFLHVHWDMCFIQEKLLSM